MTGISQQHDTARLVKTCALESGFDLVRITNAEDFEAEREVTLRRIQDGLMDGLPWFHQDRVKRGSSPRELLPGARSVICLALNYFCDDSQDPGSVQPETTGAGKIARYARGRDYHRV